MDAHLAFRCTTCLIFDKTPVWHVEESKWGNVAVVLCSGLNVGAPHVSGHVVDEVLDGVVGLEDVNVHDHEGVQTVGIGVPSQIGKLESLEQNLWNSDPRAKL